MISSKFTILASLIAVFCLVTTALNIFFLVNNEVMYSYNTPIIFKVFFSLFFLYFFSFLFFGDLRSKFVKINLNQGTIEKKGFGGLGYKHTFLFNEIDGYETSYISSRSGSYEYFYLIKNNKKVIKISEFYHANYKDLKRDIIKKGIKNLGFENWSLLMEMKEMFE